MSYQEFANRFRKLSDEELISTFNKDVGNKGVVRSRFDFHTAMKDEFKRRKLDYTEIGNEISMSWKYQIRLDGNKILRVLD